MFTFQARDSLPFQVAVTPTLPSSEAPHPAVNGGTPLESMVEVSSVDPVHSTTHIVTQQPQNLPQALHP